MFIAVGDFIKKVYEVYSKNFVAFLKYILLIAVITLVVALLAGLLVTTASIMLIGLGTVGIIIGAIVVIAAIIGLIYLTSWMNFTFMKVANDAILNQARKKMSENFKAVRPLVWTAFGTSLLVGVYAAWPLFIALMGFGISGVVASGSPIMNTLANLLRVIFGIIGLYSIFHMIYFGAKYQYAVLGTVLENKKPREAMKLSAGLIKGHWWAVFGRMFLIGLITMIISLVASMILGGLFGIFKSMVLSLLASFIIQAIQIVLSYSIVIGSIILFQNLKTLPAVEQK